MRSWYKTKANTVLNMHLKYPNKFKYTEPIIVVATIQIKSVLLVEGTGGKEAQVSETWLNNARVGQDLVPTLLMMCWLFNTYC